jgi:hypothetical protein
MLQMVLLVLPHAIMYEPVTSINVALPVVVANPDARLKQVHIAEKRDAGLVYALELASSIRVLLLAFWRRWRTFFLQVQFSQITTGCQCSWNDHLCNIFPFLAILW